MDLLYEVELNSVFEFKSRNLYLNKKDFKRVARLNNVQLHKDKLDDNIPVWKLFYIQLQNNSSSLLEEFDNNADFFEELTRLYYLKAQISKIDTKKYKKFFRLLIHMHHEFKQHQQYKLMWNLENFYLRKVIKLLLGNGVTFAKLVKMSSIEDKLYLYSIHKGNDQEYFESYSNFFIKDEMLQFFKSKYSLTKEQVTNLLFSNREYYPTLHSIIELYMRYRRFHYNEYLLLALLRSVVINVENQVKNSIGEYTKKENDKNRYVMENIKNEKAVDEVSKNKMKLFQFDLYDYLRFLSTNGRLDSLKNQFDNVEFHKRLDFLHNEPVSKDKYFYILLKARNHLAHGCGDFNKFVLHHESNLSDVLNSVIFIYIYLEYLRK